MAAMIAIPAVPVSTGSIWRRLRPPPPLRWTAAVTAPKAWTCWCSTSPRRSISTSGWTGTTAWLWTGTPSPSTARRCRARASRALRPISSATTMTPSPPRGMLLTPSPGMPASMWRPAAAMTSSAWAMSMCTMTSIWMAARAMISSGWASSAAAGLSHLRAGTAGTRSGSPPAKGCTGNWTARAR